MLRACGLGILVRLLPSNFARRLARSTTALAALWAVILAPASAPAATAARTQCDLLAQAPAPARALMCARLIRDHSTAVPLYFETSISHDGGATWTTRNSTGIALSYTTIVFQLVASADFTADKTWFVQTFDLGVYRSTDDGASWTLADPLGKQPSTWASLEPMHATLAGLLPVGGLLFANAVQEGAGSALITPPLHAPIPGTPDYTVRYAAAQGEVGKYAGTVLALAVHADHADGSGNTTRVYRCTAALSCKDVVFESAPNHGLFSDIFMAADFAKTGRVAVLTKNDTTSRYTLSLSTNGGATFSAVRGLQSVLDQVLKGTKFRTVNFGLAFSSLHPAIMYVRLHFNSIAPGVPRPEQIWRTDDSGRTWRLLGWSSRNGFTGLKGTLPWSGNFGDAADWLRGSLLIDKQDNLMLLGFRPLAPDGNYFWCSRDGARTWKSIC